MDMNSSKEVLIEETSKEKSKSKNVIHQLSLLSWKNFVLQKRSIIGTILEIFVPAIFAIILLPIRKIVKSDRYFNNIIYDSFDFESFPPSLYPKPNLIDFVHKTNLSKLEKVGLWGIGYYPNNSSLINAIMKSAEKELNANTYGFKDEETMLNFISNPEVQSLMLCGVSFLNESIQNFVYKLRFSYSPKNSNETGQIKIDNDWKTQFIYPLFPILGPREINSKEGGDPGYFREGFIQVQKAIDMSLLKQFKPDISSTIDLRLKRFPFPPFDNDLFVIVVQALLPFIIVVSFIFTVILTAKAIVYEKETGIKEAMKLMGMKTWIYWLSWYIKTFILLLPSFIFMIVSYKIKMPIKGGGEASIINHTDPILFTLFMFLYASSTITFTFLCSTFFKKANTAAAGAGVIWFLSYLPYIFISLRYEKMNLPQKIAACFVNNLALSEGVQLIGMFESKGTGINFSNWNESATVDDDFKFIYVLIVMVINNFIHLILTYYFDKVLPGDHGIAQPWYFPINFFLPKKNENEKIYSDKNSNEYLVDESAIANSEDESNYSSRNIGIKLENIGKKFRQFGVEKYAVQNLSLNIYEGQISVLLGHNGAGKSTTISMITGLCAPTTGCIKINGNDIVENTEEARSVLGYCPQHNLLFDDLTVFEHLKFFSKLKRNFDLKEIDRMLELIDLKDKKNALAKTLSGGMKRKLSVAIAFIGGSKIVILDEPSSGMDPQARHSTWSLLKKFKSENKCSILLTTHFMDEADFLGDRIAIMSNGILRCCGSPLFLKSKFGSGYSLILTKSAKQKSILKSSDGDEKNSSSIILNETDSSDKIIKLVQDIIPDAKLNSNLNSEITFILSENQSGKFPQLLNEIGNLKNELNIINIGISGATVEEVFLKIANEEENEEIQVQESVESNQTTKVKLVSAETKDFSINADSDENQNNTVEENISSVFNRNRTVQSENSTYDSDLDDYGLWIGSNSDERNESIFMLYFQQFYALIIKRIINSIRNKSLIISQIIVPICILIINLVYLKYAPIKSENSPALYIDISRFSNNHAPVYLNYSNQSKQHEFANEFASIYSQQFEKYKNSIPFNLKDNKTVDSCTENRNDIDDFLACMGKLSYANTVDNFVVGLTISIENDNKIIVTSHFNNQPYHAVPLAINLASNTLLKYLTKSNSSSITVVNHPLPRTIEDKVNELKTKDATGFNVASGLQFGFSFLMASFAIFIIRERSSNAKHLQYMSGCNSYLFWISAFIWDMINYLFPVCISMILLKAFGIDAFISEGRWVYVFGTFILYGMAHIPQMYLFSYFFTISASGFALLASWNIISGQGSFFPTSILAIPQLKLQDVANLLESIFLVFFPNFAFAQALFDLYTNNQITGFCKLVEAACPFYENPCCGNYNSTNPNKCGVGVDCLAWSEDITRWDKPGLGRFFVALPVQFIIAISIVLAYEGGILRKLVYSIQNLVIKYKKKKTQEGFSNEIISDDLPRDSDVIEEEERISNLDLKSESKNNEIFIVDRLTKYFSDFMAVKGISFSMNNADCFGLLGVNGAGKTTTFKMITGDEFITKGDAYLNGVNIKQDIKKFQKQLGYCPQFDPLIDQMTVLETMYMYARLRGIKSNLISKTCLSLIKLLDLIEHKNKMCYTLSGGNKRKLSVAISLVGSPIVILLDEPTSGMDPKTRRTLWNCLNKIRNKGKSLILTTHNMDETEALCTNIGIMVNGELKCLGSLQHLKSRYGDGYTLLVKIGLDQNEQLNQKKINDFISFTFNEFPNSQLKENRDGFLNIQINDNSLKTLSTIFSLIEVNKIKYSIEYYVVTQTKLEQIFLNFASKQIEPESRILKKATGCFC